MSLTTLLEFWKQDRDTEPNFTAWRTLPARTAVTYPLPDDLAETLAKVLLASGIHSLYSHQLEAWTHTRAGENIVLATGTASGKTLAYNLPVLATMLEDKDARALYLFPTKALAQDQLAVISHQLSVLRPLTDNLTLNAAIYDGDTPQKDRSAIRKNARIVLSNPDMLHTGILPHHTNWADSFTHLRYVVIDEMHTYRGVFGSHVANVIRRLKRIARFYGANPQFIFASATIGNPKELADNLLEAPVYLIDTDGSARGPRHFIIYNPPVTDEALGLRKSSLMESVRLTQDTLRHDLQSVVFARSRRSVELLLTYLQAPTLHPPPFSPKMGEGGGVRGYRSGYLPSQRREIEKGLRDGSVKAVVATNALELGIDIGGLGASILVGYPGSISSARQQAGRAGRGLDAAVSLMITSANPLDQFLAHHPEYFFERSPEQALVNPNHLLILLEHLRCAIFELPFQKDEGFGALPADVIKEYLEFLINNNEAHLSQEKYFWMADQYPAANISLRSASPQSVVLQATTDDGRQTTVGTVDGESAVWMTHPGAIYLHEAQSYFVESLNLEEHIAHLRLLASDYFTEPLRGTTVTVLSESDSKDVRGGQKKWGELQVTTQVTGFRKRRWYTQENLGEEPLDLPPSDLQTTGYWFSLSEEALSRLRETGAWSNDPNDYGPDWPKIRERVRARDGFKCQVCSAPETTRQHDVHHKTPFRAFRTVTSPDVARQSKEQSQETLQSVIRQANRLENLTTLCPSCHRKAEQNVHMRSGLAGLAYVLGNLAPLFLMCDPSDLGSHIEPAESAVFGPPSIVLYDLVPAGIGFSQKLFEIHNEMMARGLELASQCICQDGCPSCVGPGGENGMGGKAETLAILKELI